MIFPYIGWRGGRRRVPTQRPTATSSTSAERGEEECRQRWPELMAIVEAEGQAGARLRQDNPMVAKREYWWQFGRHAPRAVTRRSPASTRVLVAGSQASTALRVCVRCRSGMCSQQSARRVRRSTTHAAFARPPVARARGLGAILQRRSLKDDLRVHARPTASRPSRSPRTGSRTPRSSRRARPTTSSAPSSWSPTTRA